MQCHSEKYKKFVNSTLVSCCCICAVPSLAVEDKRLWLPQKYQTRFLELKQAAEKAEALDRCETVLRGTIDIDRSTTNHPIYRILCRQPDKMTYNEMVDGLSFETLTTKIEKPKELTPEEIEAARLAEEKRLAEIRAARIARHWAACETSLLQETRLFQNLKWIQSFPPEPVEKADSEDDTDLSTTFVVDFDAVNAMKQTLKYTATCFVEDLEVMEAKADSSDEENTAFKQEASNKGKENTESQEQSQKQQSPPSIKIRSRKN